MCDGAFATGLNPLNQSEYTNEIQSGVNTVNVSLMQSTAVDMMLSTRQDAQATEPSKPDVAAPSIKNNTATILD